MKFSASTVFLATMAIGHGAALPVATSNRAPRTIPIAALSTSAVISHRREEVATPVAITDQRPLPSRSGESSLRVIRRTQVAQALARFVDINQRREEVATPVAITDQRPLPSRSGESSLRVIRRIQVAEALAKFVDINQRREEVAIPVTVLTTSAVINQKREEVATPVNVTMGTQVAEAIAKFVDINQRREEVATPVTITDHTPSELATAGRSKGWKSDQTTTTWSVVKPSPLVLLSATQMIPHTPDAAAHRYISRSKSRLVDYGFPSPAASSPSTSATPFVSARVAGLLWGGHPHFCQHQESLPACDQSGLCLRALSQSTPIALQTTKHSLKISRQVFHVSDHARL
ncbi:unnamed protein product [Zymoseptoria tritici ST99CH_1A5]|uniref:Uncharacterized protein n=1 Tax=Zymoseptoria tritici ST99CH_1A5 TaxID=1276529 RepID=A0A1Y6LSV5_ZYMTR|nr:unnamed protein product [Zymoseptoria tritici ST99CH_1A5]